jgi:hypothetical protein
VIPFLQAGAQDAILRLVAADRPDRPLCSAVTDFRYSPLGGLVTVDWLGGVTLDGKTLFPLKDLKAIGPGHEVDMGGRVKAGGIMDEIEEMAAEKKRAETAQEPAGSRVDPLYQGKTFPNLPDKKEIGPSFSRPSQQPVSLADGGLLQPGGLALARGKVGELGSEHIKAVPGGLEVDCYPVRIEAVREGQPGRKIAFTPELQWENRDLLTDARADYSPALPTGAPSALLDAKGRPRVFFELTLYLLPTKHLAGESQPYRLNGEAFHLGKEGVSLAGGKGRLVKTGPFSLQWVVPAPATNGVETAGAPWVIAARDGQLRLSPSPRLPGRIIPAAWEVRIGAFPSLSGEESVRPVKSEPDGNWSLDVADLPAGLYRVRVPDFFPEAGNPPLFAVISPKRVQGSVSLFTYHNRCDYRQGEMIEVTAALRAVEPVEDRAVELVLRDEAGAENVIGRLFFSAPKGGSDSRMISIPAGQIQPGRYLLGVKADGSLIGHRILLQIFPKELRTTWEGFSTRICETGPFRTTEGLCSYRTLRDGPVHSLRPGAETDFYTGQAVLSTSALASCRQDPLFPVEEAAAGYDENEKEMAAAMRFGVQHLPEGAWGMDGQTASWNPKHSYGESLDWMRRMYAQRTQIFREFASFGGFFLNWYPSLGPHYESHPPAAGFADYQQAALQKAVQEAQGPIPAGWGWKKENGLFFTKADGSIVKEGDVLKEGASHPFFYSLEMQALMEWKLRGQRRRTQAFAQAYDAWTEVSRTLGQWDYLSFVPVGWFRGPDYYPPLYFASLPRAGIHAYTDWQVDPFMELFGIDYYGAGSGKPPWVQMMSGNRSMQIRQTFLSAARGAWGVGCDTGSALPQGRDGEDARQVAGLMQSYGPWFMGMKPVSEVAIVRSFRQEAADAGAFRDSGGRNGMIWFQGLQGELWMLYYNLLRSGYPAAFITEEEIAAGGLSRYKAVFLHRQRLLMPPEMMKKFQEYTDAGGKVFKDATTAAPYPGEVVDLSADASIKPDVGSSSHIIGARYLWMLQNYLTRKPRLDAVLARLPKPRVRSDHYHIVHAEMTGQEVSAVFVINDTMAPAAVHTAENWFIQGKTLARKSALFLDKPYFVYDVTESCTGQETRATREQGSGTGLLTRAPAEDLAKGSGTGLLTRAPAESNQARATEEGYVYPLDFTRSEGRILVMSERPIHDVTLKAQWVSRPDGDVLRVEPLVLDDKGKPFADALPFEVTVLDADGRECKRVFRTAGPGATVELAMGRNGAGGSWTVKARELASGREASAVLSLKALPPMAPVVQGDGKVLARRPGEIARFLAGKKAVTIVLDEGQPDSCRQAAEKLASLMKRQGKACEILNLDPLQVYDLPLRWRRNAYDSNVWDRVARGDAVAVRRGLSTLSDQDWAYYDHPDSGYTQPGAQFALFRDVILIGSPRDHRMLADLHGVFNRPASEHCPGPGGALIQVSWDAFAPRFDALSVQASDSEGLAAGLAWLEASLKPAAPVASVERPIATGEFSGPSVQRSLPDVQRDGFGTPVGFIQPVEGGSNWLVSLAGADMSGPAHFLLDRDGGHVKPIGDILGALTPLAGGQFLQSWRDQCVLRGAALEPLWQLRGSGKGRVINPETLDMYVGSANRVLRLDRDGKTVWIRDFSGDVRAETDFLKPWKATVRAVSGDGKQVLVSGYREKLYGDMVEGYEDAALLLLDAASGATLWRRPGVLVADTACAFAGDKIAACQPGNGKTGESPKLIVLDGAGKLLLDVPVKEPLTRIQPLGNGGLALVEKASGQGAGLFDMNKGQFLEFPVKGTIKAVWVLGERIAIATWDRALHVFDGSLKRLETARLSSPAGAVAAGPDGKGLIVGTDSGYVEWLDAAGQVVRTVDLNPLNVATNEEAWARRWLALSLGSVPMRRVSPWVGKPVSTVEQAARFASVSASLVKNGDFEQDAQGWTVDGKAEGMADGLEGKALRLGGSVGQVFACKPGRTYVVSLFQKAPDSLAAADGVRLKIVFKGKRDVFEAVLPLSAGWEERTASFRPPAGAVEAELTVTVEKKAKATEAGYAELDRLVVSAVDFRSPNGLLQHVEKGPSIDIGDLNLGDAKDEGDALNGKPADIKQVIPWVSHLAKATGAGEMAPRIVTPWFNLVDGKLSGQESSWTGKPVPQGIFSDHAEMVITFDKARPLNLIALYEDPADPARYTRRFAVFAKTSKGVRLLGFRENNQSPYNLFSFDTVEADSLIYIWDGSGDGHIRLMEIEAYGGL